MFWEVLKLYNMNKPYIFHNLNSHNKIQRHLYIKDEPWLLSTDKSHIRCIHANVYSMRRHTNSINLSHLFSSVCGWQDSWTDWASSWNPPTVCFDQEWPRDLSGETETRLIRCCSSPIKIMTLLSVALYQTVTVTCCSVCAKPKLSVTAVWKFCTCL